MRTLLSPGDSSRLYKFPPQLIPAIFHTKDCLWRDYKWLSCRLMRSSESLVG
jgi:hypothetical protein